MARIDYFFSLLSPFTYLAGLELERIADRQAAEIAYRPMDIMEVFGATGGVPLGKRHHTRIAYREQELKRIVKRTGFKFNLRPAHWPVDVTRASCTVIAASKKAGEDETDTGALAHALLKAVWAGERDISEASTIRAVINDIGLDPTLVDEAGDYRDEYAANTREAIEKGVFGSPFYVVDDGEMFWGQDRLADLERHLAAR